MRYAKLVNEKLYFAPKKINYNDAVVYNPSVEMLIADGYKPVNELSAPEAPEGYMYELSYEDAGDSIKYIWTLIESEVTAEELLNILLGE